VTRVRGIERLDLVRPEGVAEGSVVSIFRVPPEVDGQRLDVFLRDQLKRTSRTRTQWIIRVSAYSEDGRRLKPNDRVRSEQQVFLWRAPWDEDPVPTDITVLYEDDHLLAVDKPANLPVHPSARYHKNTLIKLLHAQRPGEFLSLGHRLDRETSGVLLVSKTPECDRALKRQLELRDNVDKTYTAITWGVPDDGSGATEMRIARGMELDRANAFRVKMRLSEGPDALSAATRFEVLGVARARGGDGDAERVYACVRCELETGRQHQIRVHLSFALGTPIVGDKLYGPDEELFARGVDGALTAADVALLELPRHALHASRLRLAHPVTGHALEITAPLPADLAEFWASCERRAASEPPTGGGQE
jgi:23S rRNA pseudouridine1911/1915/1917 synthase